MLAVFRRSVATMPEELVKPYPNDAVSAMTTDFLNTRFLFANPNSVSVQLGLSGFLAYSLEIRNTLLPRSFSSKDGIFCLFQGNIENNTAMKLKYGLTKMTDDAPIPLEAYRVLRDRLNETKCPERVIKEFEGLWAFIVIDINTNTIFIGSDSQRNNPFYWGTDVEGNFVFSDDPEIVKQACHRSRGPFPKNCLFTTGMGLRNLEYPMYEMKAIPIRDGRRGRICGTKFEVDTGTQRPAQYRRQGTNSYYWTGEI